MDGGSAEPTGCLPSGTEVGALVIDAQPRSHLSRLTWANHPDTPSPMDTVRLRTVMLAASTGMAREEYSEDVACCLALQLQGGPLLFGNPGDGLDIIGTEAKALPRQFHLLQLTAPSHRVNGLHFEIQHDCDLFRLEQPISLELFEHNVW